MATNLILWWIKTSIRWTWTITKICRIWHIKWANKDSLKISTSSSKHTSSNTIRTKYLANHKVSRSYQVRITTRKYNQIRFWVMLEQFITKFILDSKINSLQIEILRRLPSNIYSLSNKQPKLKSTKCSNRIFCFTYSSSSMHSKLVSSSRTFTILNKTKVKW